jgi:hypothetical protein
MNEMQTAEVLELSDRQVRRDWAFAKSWLLNQLQAHTHALPLPSNVAS